jgi:hypothetical protein
MPVPSYENTLLLELVLDQKGIPCLAYYLRIQYPNSLYRFGQRLSRPNLASRVRVQIT